MQGLLLTGLIQMPCTMDHSSYGEGIPTKTKEYISNKGHGDVGNDPNDYGKAKPLRKTGNEPEVWI